MALIDESRLLIENYFKLLLENAKRLENLKWANPKNEHDLNPFDKPNVKTNIKNEVELLTEKLHNMRTEIRKKVKPQAIEGLLNITFDTLFPNGKLTAYTASYYEAGVRDILKTMHDKEHANTTRKAKLYTFLTCFAIVTIPFANLIYNKFLSKLYSKQNIQRCLSDHDARDKINNKYPHGDRVEYVDTSTDNIFRQLMLKRKDIEDEEDKVLSRYLQSYAKSNLSKSDFFNKNGEHRKIRSGEQQFSEITFSKGNMKNYNVVFATKEQVIRHKYFNDNKKYLESKNQSKENIQSIINKCR